MVLELKQNNYFPNLKDIFLRKDNQLLKIFYGGNDDLYFDILGQRSINSDGKSSASFCIEPGDEVYADFVKLVNDIVLCNVYDELELFDSPGEIRKTDKNTVQWNQKLKDDWNYVRLVQEGSVYWYSDSIYDEKANLLKIDTNDEKITLSFVDNREDPIFGFGVQICNSGSKYNPFNLCFMKLFNEYQKEEKLKPSNKTLVK